MAGRECESERERAGNGRRERKCAYDGNFPRLVAAAQKRKTKPEPKTKTKGEEAQKQLHAVALCVSVCECVKAAGPRRGREGKRAGSPGQGRAECGPTCCLATRAARPDAGFIIIVNMPTERGKLDQGQGWGHGQGQSEVAVELLCRDRC